MISECNLIFGVACWRRSDGGRGLSPLMLHTGWNESSESPGVIFALPGLGFRPWRGRTSLAGG